MEKWQDDGEEETRQKKGSVRWGCLLTLVSAVMLMTVLLGSLATNLFDPTRELIGLWAYGTVDKNTIRFLKDGAIADALDGPFGLSTYEVNGDVIHISSDLTGKHVYRFQVVGDVMTFTNVETGKTELQFQRLE